MCVLYSFMHSFTCVFSQVSSPCALTCICTHVLQHIHNHIPIHKLDHNVCASVCRENSNLRTDTRALVSLSLETHDKKSSEKLFLLSGDAARQYLQQHWSKNQSTTVLVKGPSCNTYHAYIHTGTYHDWRLSKIIAYIVLQKSEHEIVSIKPWFSALSHVTWPCWKFKKVQSFTQLTHMHNVCVSACWVLNYRHHHHSAVLTPTFWVFSDSDFCHMSDQADLVFTAVFTWTEHSCSVQRQKF